VALFAFDGTWNEAKDNDDPKYGNTNVVRFYNAYHAHSNTQDFYVAGVGTRFDLIGRVAGGVFGLGELPRIDEAYDHACQTWAAGDHVIDVVGFSRGAATTLDFCHCVQERGIRRPGSKEVVEPKPKIRFLGVWDVVGAFGLANLGNVDLNIGHHLSLPKANLEYCFHALALDERRPSFLPTRLNGACEVWFRGVHSDIGGGNGNRGLNDITLAWMMRKAHAAGLPIAVEDVAALKPDPTAAPKPAKNLPLNVRLIGAVDRGHYTVAPLSGFASLPPTCSVETVTDEALAHELGAEALEVLPIDVRRRIAAMWETADAVATAQGYSLSLVRDPLLTLFQGRVPLITDEDTLTTARRAAARLTADMIHGAKSRGFNTLPEFFLTEALFNTRPLFPFTD
jgi:hypothetical protein